MKRRISPIKHGALAAAMFALAGPLQAALVLDDPLNGSTIAPSTGGARQGGTFLPGGGWRVRSVAAGDGQNGPYDCIYWHVAPTPSGVFEYDVTGIGPDNVDDNGVQPYAGSNELSHMYDWTFAKNGEADADTGFWSYRDNAYKQYIRKQGDPGPPFDKRYTLECIWCFSGGCAPNEDTAPLSWAVGATYHFRMEWEWKSALNQTELRIYRNGASLLTQTTSGPFSPGGWSVRIGASTRHSNEDASLGAVYSNVGVYNSFEVSPPGAPTIAKPTNGQTVTTTLPAIEWTGPVHDKYQVRISTQDNPDADPVWDSFEALSGKNYCATGPLADYATYYAFVRLGNSAGYGPWSAGRQFTVNTSSVVPNTVRVAGDSLADRNGPFLGLGATYFSGLRFYHNGVNGNTADWNKLNSELALLRDGDFKFVRILSTVAWDGKEIAPVSFTNCAGRAVAAWPNYWTEFQGFLDLVASYGMRTEITVFADAQCVMPSTATRQQHVATMCTKIAGREDKIILIEMANEAWQNGFPDPGGRDELCGYATTMRACTTVPIALSSPSDMSDTGICNYYGRCPAANIATAHFARDLNDDGWAAVIDSYRTGPCLPGVPPISSNEPIGPGSSVAEERDPIRLVMAAVVAWGANLPMYVWHSRAGIYGEDEKPGCPTMPGATCKLQDEAAVHDFVHLNEILAPDLSSWVRNDGREASAPFTTYCNGQANKWWPEVGGATSGVVRNTGSIKGHEFYTYPIGILGNGVEMEARRLVSFQVYNPLTGEIVASMTRQTGERFTLPQGPRAYIIKGVFGEVCGQSNGASVSIDLGCPDVVSGITNVQNADGNTSCVTVGGQTCRMNTNPGAGDYYFYFGVSDSWAFRASKPDVYISIEYSDTGTGSLALQYDSNTGSDLPAFYKSGGSVALTNTNAWKSKTFHVTDAYFGNRQNAGADFRIGEVGGTFYLDRVSVMTEQPLPPVIAEVTPDPEIVFPGNPYTRQLELLQGSPWPTWTVLDGPTGLKVSTCGLVSGWTPGTGDVGDHPVEIQADNFMGSDAESWVVRVVSRKDFDHDGDVDQEDFGLFQHCLSGSGVGQGQGCASTDFDSDGDVDQDDFGLFRACMAGSHQPPGC